jgi:hypothetical protein
VPITLDHTIRRKLAASSGATFRVTSSATVIDLSRKYRHHGKQLVLSAEPIGSRDGKNRSCLLLEINATERGKCRRSRQKALNALFFSYYARYTSICAHNIRGHARNFCALVFLWNTPARGRNGPRAPPGWQFGSI